jgi:gamma-glutamylcyclotransferase (GGCT)/AIG2-like uncharacterized protein YtfP
MGDHLLFVYGKLRKGGALPMDENFPGSVFVDDARVNGKLYDLGRFPGLVIDGSVSKALGAVYEIDDETLKQLDEIEASAGYYRELHDVTVDGRTVTGWIYLPDRKKCTDDKLIESGDWIEHSRSRN